MPPNLQPLPDCVTRYFEAANRFDAKAAADCFTANASVHDENHNHVGQDAIRDWVAETSRKYQPQFKIVSVKANDEKLVLSVGVSGSFPGSPIELDYQIQLRDGKISALDIS